MSRFRILCWLGIHHWRTRTYHTQSAGAPCVEYGWRLTRCTRCGRRRHP